MIHQYLDIYVKDGLIDKYGDFWALCCEKGLIDSVKSVLIGQLYGGSLRLLSNALGCEEEELRENDLHEFNEIFLSRLEGIEKEIEEIIDQNKHK